MIRPAREEVELSDDEFAKIIDPEDKAIRNFLDNEFVYDFFAFCIATSYNCDSLWEDCNLEYEFKDAMYYLNNMPTFDKIDIKKFKKILKEKHSLKLTSVDPLRIEEIKWPFPLYSSKNLSTLTSKTTDIL